MLRPAIVVVVGTMLGVVPTALLAPTAHATNGTFIVVLRDGAAIGSAKPPGIVTQQVYTTALNGYAATMSDDTATALKSNPNVVSVKPDVDVSVADGTIALGGVSTAAASTEIAPFGVVRIGTLQSKTAKIDAKDERVDADVAVLDTGVDRKHADINFAGGVDCLPRDPDEHPDQQGGYDPNGHGTIIAGVIGAIDNTFGVVGVAPGARIWSVKVLRKNGTGSLSAVLCGIDWVAAHAKTIDVVNMSIGFRGTESRHCGFGEGDTLHQAICRAERRGVTIVAGAGNDAADTDHTLPAAYNDVIAVSAFADYDGRPGGLAAMDPNCAGQGDDDHLATFSNFGKDIDISAPGVCVRSTYPGSLYATASGTSFAAPHVAGAAALYIANHHNAGPKRVRRAILGAAEPGPIAGDPDGFPEGIVNVSTF